MIDVVWIWTTHKACTLYVGGNRTHRHNPNVFNPYACLLTIRCLPFCIHINSRCPPTSADIVNRTRTTFLLDSLASYWNTFIPYRQMGERGIEPLLFTTWEQIYSLPQHHQSLPFTPNFLCIAKNIRKEAVSTFFARVMLTGGLEPPFCTNAYSV